jgi:hypothetical protein
MADAREEADKAREYARRAREAAERMRHEADRLRQEKRSEANNLRSEAVRLRNEAREMERRARHEERARTRGHAGRQDWDHTVVGFAGAQGDSGGAGSASATESFSANGLTEVRIHQTAGKLTVRACEPGEEPSITTYGNKSAPQLEVTRDGGRVRIEITLSTGWLFRRRQGATSTLKLPQALKKVDIDLGYGEVQVRDVSSDIIKVNAGAGEIATYSLAGNLEADVGAGKIAVHDHRGVVRSNAGTGDAMVDIAETVPGDYHLEVGMGRVELRLPPGEIVTIRASSGIGKKRIDYPQGPENAPIRIAVETGIGEAVVKARAQGKAPEQPRDFAIRPQRSGRSTPAPRRHEAEELRVLEMLEQGKISSQEAAELIAALQGAARPPDVEEDGAGPEPAPFS